MTQSKSRGAKIPDAIARYLEHLKDVTPSGHTFAGYRRDLLCFARWWEETTGEELSPERVTSVDLREYQEWMRATKGLKPATINRRMDALRAWLKWAAREGLAPRVPDFPKPIPQVRQAPQALERAEVNRLLRELEKEGDTRDIALVRLLLSCGLRLSEAVALKVADVELSERRGKVTVRRGKGSKWREVPLPPEARKALAAWLDKHPGGEWLFPGREGDHLSASAAWRVVKKYAWRARIPGLHPHTLRHTCAYNMLRAGADIVTVAEVLGHSRLDTTAVYTRPRLADMERALERGEV
ncbi:tyrosine-type recombinase/integrase [Desulfovirgula thermocuniculi]|uniref:tyrosine-type recombinase/integrase n=1 Tax=Desulfovirgula thermocuniculi TaxID=348842 RepID=UPI0009FC0953|nr:tyrosine-type recombinase/integrase [Desulfovirgula thermocuniculi]